MSRPRPQHPLGAFALLSLLALLPHLAHAQAVFSVVASEFSLDPSISDFHAPGTILDATVAGMLGISGTGQTNVAGLYYVKHLEVAAPAEYTITCTDDAGWFTSATCIVPEGAATDSTHPCLVEFADLSTAGPAPVGQTYPEATVTCTDGTGQHAFTAAYIGSGGTGDVKIFPGTGARTQTGSLTWSNPMILFDTSGAGVTEHLGVARGTLPADFVPWTITADSADEGVKFTCISARPDLVPVTVAESDNAFAGTPYPPTGTDPLSGPVTMNPVPALDPNDATMVPNTVATVWVTCMVTAGGAATYGKGDTGSFQITVLPQFRVVRGTGFGYWGTIGGEPPVTALTAATSTPVVMDQDAWYANGLFLMVEHLGAPLASDSAGYTVQCTNASTNPVVIRDLACHVGGGPTRAADDPLAGYFPCHVEAHPGSSDLDLTAEIRCSGPSANVAYATGYTVGTYDLFTFFAQQTSPRASSVASVSPAGALPAAARGVTLDGSETIDVLDRTTIPLVYENSLTTFPDTSVWKLIGAVGRNIDLVFCTSDRPEIIGVSHSAISVSDAGVGLPVTSMGPTYGRDVLVTVTCVNEGGGGLFSTAVLVAGSPLYAVRRVGDPNPCPTSPDQALSVAEGTDLVLELVVDRDVSYGVDYEVVCMPDAGAPLGVMALGNDRLTGSAPSDPTPMGHVLEGSNATFRASGVSGDSDVFAVTCTHVLNSGSAIAGAPAQTFYAKVVDTALPVALYTTSIITDSTTGNSTITPVPLSQDLVNPTVLEEGSLSILALATSDNMDVSSGADGSLTCTEVGPVGTLKLTPVRPTATYVMSLNTRQGDALNGAPVLFKTILSGTEHALGIQLSCVGDGVVVDSTPIVVYVSVINNRSTSQLQCELATAYLGSGLDLVTVNAVDKASVTLVVDHIGIALYAGTDARVAESDTAMYPTGQRLLPTMRVAVVEGVDYGMGGIVRVGLTDPPPENVTVSCKSGNTTILPDSGVFEDFTLIFDADTATTTVQNLRLGRAAAMSVGGDTEITLTCTGLGEMGLVLRPTTVVLRVEPLRIIIESGPSMLDATSRALVGSGVSVGNHADLATATAAGHVAVRVEGSPDEGGDTFRVRLNGAPTSSTTVTCTSNDTTTLPNGETTDYIFVFTPNNATDLNFMSLGVITDIAAPVDITITCSPLPVGGFESGDNVSVYVRAESLAVLVEAGSAARLPLANGASSVAPGTTVAGGVTASTVIALARLEKEADVSGATVQLRLNSPPSVNVEVQCTSSDTSVLLDAGLSENVVFTPSNATLAQPISLGRTLVITGTASSQVTVSCGVTSDAGGLLTTELATFTLEVEQLTLGLVAGTAATRAAAWQPVLIAPAAVEDPTRQWPEGTPLHTLPNATQMEAVPVLEVVAGQSSAEGVLLGVTRNSGDGALTSLTCGSDTPYINVTSPTFANGEVGPKPLTVTADPVLVPGLNYIHEPRARVWCRGDPTDPTAPLPVEVMVVVRGIRVEILWGTDAQNQWGWTAIPDTPVRDDEMVRRVEGVDDSVSSSTLRIVLSGQPYETSRTDVEIKVNCVSSNLAVLDTGTDGLWFTFTPANATTPQSVTLPTVADISNGQAVDVTFTCQAMTTGPGAADDTTSRGDPNVFSPRSVRSGRYGLGGTYVSGPTVGISSRAVTIRAEPRRLEFVAGAQARDAYGMPYLAGERITRGLSVIEHQADAEGRTLYLRVNAPPSGDPNTAVVSVVCSSDAVNVQDGQGPMADPVAGTPTTFTFANWTVAQPLTLATLGPLTLQNEGVQDINVTCTTGNEGGFETATSRAQVAIKRVALRLSLVTSTDAITAPGATLIPSGYALTEHASSAAAQAAGELLYRHEYATDGGQTVSAVFNGKPTAIVTLVCTSSNTNIMESPSADTPTTFDPAEDSGVTPKPILLGKVKATRANTGPVKVTCAPSSSAGGIDMLDTVSVWIQPRMMAIELRAGPQAKNGDGTFNSTPVVIPYVNSVLVAQDVLMLQAGTATDAGDVVQVGLSSPAAADLVITCTSLTPLVVPNAATGSTANISESGSGPLPILLGMPGLDVAFSATAGTEALQAAPTRNALVAGSALVSGEVCKSILLYENRPTAAGSLVRVMLGPQTVGATMGCISSNNALLANISGVTLDTQVVDVPIPTSALSPVDTLVTYTCNVLDGPTAGNQVAFDVLVAPLRAMAYAGGANGVQEEVTRRSDFGLMGTGAEVGYTDTSSYDKTIVLSEGAGLKVRTVSLGLSVNPGNPGVEYTCFSSDPLISPDLTPIRLTSTARVALTIPNYSAVFVDTTITYTCTPTVDGGGYNSLAPNHAVKFDVFVQRATFAAVTSVSALNRTGELASANTPLVTTTSVTSTEVPAVTPSTTKNIVVALKPTRAPGATGVAITCVSSDPTIMNHISNITLNNIATATPITLPDFSPVAVDSLVHYECSVVTPGGIFDQMTPTYSFSLIILAFKIRVVNLAANTLITADSVAPATALGLKLTTGAVNTQTEHDNYLSNSVQTVSTAGAVAPAPGAGVVVAIFEGSPAAVGTLAMRVNKFPDAEVRMVCVSDKPNVMADLEPVVLPTTTSSSSVVNIKLSKAQAVPADTLVSFTCSPDASFVAPEAFKRALDVTFQLMVRNLTVVAVSNAQTSFVYAADGASFLPPLMPLATSATDLAHMPQMVEKQTMSNTIAALQARAVPAVPIMYYCVSTVPEVLRHPGIVNVAGAGAATFFLQEPVNVTGDTVVEIVCLPNPNVAGQVYVTENLNFHVMVRRIVATAVRGGQNGEQIASAAGTSIPYEAKLISGDTSRTPTVDTTVFTAAGTVVKIAFNSIPTASVKYTCASSDPDIMGDIAQFTARGASVNVTLPRPSEVTILTTVTFTCAPLEATAGLEVTDAVVFDVAVKPRRAFVAAAVNLVAVSGSAIPFGTDLSGGGSDLTYRIYSGTVNGISSVIKLSVAPTDSRLRYSCTSSNPSVIGDIPSVAMDATSNSLGVSLNLPVAAAVTGDVPITYTCAPVTDAGGYTNAQTTEFHVIVSSVGVEILTGSGSVGRLAADGTSVFTAGQILSGTTGLATTLTMWEAQNADNTRVAIRSTAMLSSAAIVGCTSSDPTVMANTSNVSMNENTIAPVAITLPRPAAVSGSTVITYSCAEVAGAGGAVTSQIQGSVTFRVQVNQLQSIVVASPIIPMAVNGLPLSVAETFSLIPGAANPPVEYWNLSFIQPTSAERAARTISGANDWNQDTHTPRIPYRSVTAAGEVVWIGMTSAPENPVIFRCTSDKPSRMDHLPDVTVSDGNLVALSLPKPVGVMGINELKEYVVYSCAATGSVADQNVPAPVYFRVQVVNHGLKVMAGTNAHRVDDLENYLQPTLDVGVSASNGGIGGQFLTTPQTVAIYAEQPSHTALMMATYTGVEGTDVNCTSSQPNVMANFNVENVGFQPVPVQIPASKPLVADTRVSFTCVVECPSADYTGSEAVTFDVFVIKRRLIAAAGSAPGTAADRQTAILSGSPLLAPGSSSATTLAIMEKDVATMPGVLVDIFGTTNPTSQVPINCTSSHPTVLDHVNDGMLNLSSNYVPYDTVSTGGVTNVDMGVLPYGLLIPVAQYVERDTRVTYACRPTRNAGGYTTLQSVSFDVVVINQKVHYVLGSAASGTNLLGGPASPNDEITALSVMEKRTYNSTSAIVVYVSSHGHDVRVTCSITSEFGSSTSVYYFDPLTLDTNPEITITAGQLTPLTFSTMPTASSGDKIMTLTCTPTQTNANTGFNSLDQFHLPITVVDVEPEPREVPTDAITVTFDISMAFNTMPSTAQINAHASLVANQTATSLGVDPSTVIVVPGTPTASRRRQRRALQQTTYTVVHVVTVIANSQGHAQTLVTNVAVASSSISQATINAIAAAATTQGHALYGSGTPTVTVTTATAPPPPPGSVPVSTSTPLPFIPRTSVGTYDVVIPASRAMKDGVMMWGGWVATLVVVGMVAVAT